MDTPASSALKYFHGFSALVERLAKGGVVLRRLSCDWSVFGSWTIEVSNNDDEAKRSAAIQRKEYDGPGPEVFRISWDGKDRELQMESTPTGVISMLNRWRSLDHRHCDSGEVALEVAEEWFYARLR